MSPGLKFAVLRFQHFLYFYISNHSAFLLLEVKHVFFFLSLLKDIESAIALVSFSQVRYTKIHQDTTGFCGNILGYLSVDISVPFPKSLAQGLL